MGAPARTPTGERHAQVVCDVTRNLLYVLYQYVDTIEHGVNGSHELIKFVAGAAFWMRCIGRPAMMA